MNVKYYEDHQIENNRYSIFLAGPTPRSENVESWRPQAIEILEKLGFDGDVFYPEFHTRKFSDLEVKEIIDWELEHLDRASVICFWVPRELEKMPAFTTNIEFGYHLLKKDIVYGRPSDAPKNRYLDYLYEKFLLQKPCETLLQTLQKCLGKIKREQKQIFFTSDTHFGSERTLKLSKRPYRNVQEMDEDLVRKWNQRISPNDIVYHLGDWGDYDTIKKLNGKIVLVLGNYEEIDLRQNFNNNFEKFKNYLVEKGFFDVVKDGMYVNLNDGRYYCTHKPLDYKKNDFNLFGHVHEKSMCKKFGLNVGVDCHHFYPISEDVVSFYKNVIQNHCNKNVFC